MEDPIEMVHEDFNQIAVKPQLGITFGSIMRNILRQDPDIILVGEIRDEETAREAFRAANTGELEAIYQLLDQLEPTGEDELVFRPQASLAHWPLAVAMLLTGLYGAALLAPRPRRRGTA